MRSPKSSLVLLALLAIACLPGLARAEDEATPSPVAPAATPEAEESTDKYSAEELKELVGPIALYPDIVLGPLLPATNFPIDVVQAARYLKAHDNKVDEVPKEGKNWDKSVQALLQYPDVINWMDDNLAWMQQIGYAVAVQQDEVLQAIQDFRKEAKAAGNLESNEYMNVEEETIAEAAEEGYADPNAVADAGNESVIIIESSDPEVVYVPTYNPTSVTQPYYGAAPLYGFGAGFAVGAIGAWAWHSVAWGGGGWGGSINVNKNLNVNRPNRPGGRPPNNWRPPNRPGPGNRPGGPGTGRPGKPGGPVNRPGKPGWGNKPGGRPGTGRPGTGRPGGGVKPPPGAGRPGGGNRPGTGRPDFGGGGSRPGGGNVARPTPAPNRSSFGGANRGGNRSGANRSGGSNRASNRGSSSMGNRRSSTPSNRSTSRSSGRSGSRSSYTRRPSSSRSRSAYSGRSRGGSRSRASSSRGRSSMGRSRGGGGRSRGGGGRRGGGRRR